MDDKEYDNNARPIFFAVWFGLNCSMSYYQLLCEPRTSYFQLTCLTQHAVTVFSLLLLLSPSFVDNNKHTSLNEHYSYTLGHVHTQLTILTSKICILFTGLLLVILVHYGATNNPVTKRKRITVMRVVRNLYTHYGTCVVHWWLGPNITSVQSLHVSNVVLLTWLVLVSPWITKIYNVEKLRTRQLVIPLAILSVMTDVLMMRLLDLH